MNLIYSKNTYCSLKECLVVINNNYDLLNQSVLSFQAAFFSPKIKCPAMSVNLLILLGPGGSTLH